MCLLWCPQNAPKCLFSSENVYVAVSTLNTSGATEKIDPSKVRALPLGVAAERSVHHFLDYFLFLLSGFLSGFVFTDLGL